MQTQKYFYYLFINYVIFKYNPKILTENHLTTHRINMLYNTVK